LSLRDALLAKGLVSEKRARELAREQKDQRKQEQSARKGKREVETEAARAALPRQISLEDAVFNLQRACLAAMRIARARHLGAAAPFEDRLHQRHRLALEPRLANAFEALGRLSAIEAHFLSGSGSTVLAIPRAPDEAVAAAKQAFAQAGLEAEVRLSRADNRGLQLLD
jgi:homoserine kinase